MEINGYTRLCGLIGNPVEHTLSPAIHNALAEKLLHNLVYVPFHVEKENLGDAVKGAYGLNVLGLNVTVPFKSDVIAYLQDIDDLAGKIGAVNTLVRTEKGYKGYNTDILGLFRAMCSEGIVLEGEKIVLLGAGGAARAAAFLCAKEGAEQVYLLNRSVDKAEKLAEEVNRSFGRSCIRPVAMDDYEKLPNQKMLVIQGTSVGLFPDADHAIIEDKEFYKNIHTAYDLIYKPAETKFMHLVREAGGKAYNGLKMLLYQGIIAYELWNDVEINEETADEIYDLLRERVKV
ncbi:MAG: shikimate dehydrogenase [Suilimivivens sp.]